MNRVQYLLLKLGEESAEVMQIASKCMQFGLFEKKPGLDQTNIDRLVDEYNDVLAQVEMLEEAGIPMPISRLKIEAKKAKCENFYEYSRSLGWVTEDLPVRPTYLEKQILAFKEYIDLTLRRELQPDSGIGGRVSPLSASVSVEFPIEARNALDYIEQKAPDYGFVYNGHICREDKLVVTFDIDISEDEIVEGFKAFTK